MNEKQNGLNSLSEQLLLNVKLKKDTSDIQLQLENLEAEDLKNNLINDQKKKAFWINIYNAYFQILRIEKKIGKPDIYKKKTFKIAKELMSLDDVEHGVLRKGKFKYSLGFFRNFFTSDFIKKLEVDELDYRIHFALNCGAKSCPPIAFYNSEKINQQLDMATQAFLESESDFDDQNKIVRTTALFKWFYADFGRTKGIKRIYKEQLDKNISDYKLKFKEYSWEEDLENFVT